MAERRMFSRTIIDSDAFLDMPHSAQCLYFHLGMKADDDGFINNPKSIMRIIGSREDDLRLLAAKSFIIPFESGIVVITHWKTHNYIPKDRYTPTKCIEEMSTLFLDKNKSYALGSTQDAISQQEPVYTLNTECIQIPPEMDTSCIQDVHNLETQVRLGKVREGKDREEESEIHSATPLESSPKPSSTKRFIIPTIEEIQQYGKESGYAIDPNKFINHYASNGWMVGKAKMKDWKAAVRNWFLRDHPDGPKKKKENSGYFLN